MNIESNDSEHENNSLCIIAGDKLPSNVDNGPSQDNLDEVDMEMEDEMLHTTEMTKPGCSADDINLYAINSNDVNNTNKYSADNCKNIDLETSSISTYNCSSQAEIKNANEEPKSHKMVRFLNATPKEDIQLDCASVTATDQTSEQTISNSAFPKHKPKRRSIQVQIPVHFRTG